MPRARRRRLQRQRKKERIQRRATLLATKLWLRNSEFGRQLTNSVLENAFAEPLFPELFHP